MILLLQIFMVFFRIGAFAIGGAYSFLPLLQKDIVERYHWLTKEEFLDVLGMVKVFPGAISIKFATYTGYKLAGMGGAIAANAGNLLAPFMITLGLAYGYSRYKNVPSVNHALAIVQWVVFGMILTVAFQAVNVSQIFHWKNFLVIIITVTLFLFTKIDPALIIIAAAMIGIFVKY